MTEKGVSEKYLILKDLETEICLNAGKWIPQLLRTQLKLFLMSLQGGRILKL